jgi:hypothetical protein
VTQTIVLLTDPDAAARWFKTKLRTFEGYEGREVDGFLYRSVVTDPLVAFADEAAVVVAQTEAQQLDFLEEPGLPFVDTHANFRRGRLFAGVGASTYKELDVRAPLTELAKALLSRIDGILAENQR